MHIHQKARVALSGIGGQIGGGQGVALPQFDCRMGDAVDLADLAEAVAEAAAGHHQQPVVLGEHVLGDGIHGGRAGAGEEYRSGILRGIHELLEQRLVLLHQGGEVRRAEVGHGVCTDPGDLLRDLNRAHRKVDMILLMSIKLYSPFTGTCHRVRSAAGTLSSVSSISAPSASQKIKDTSLIFRNTLFMNSASTSPKATTASVVIVHRDSCGCRRI